MDIGELRIVLTTHFAALGHQPAMEILGLDFSLSNGSERWGFALCPEREEGEAFLGSFEAAMQRLVDARRADAALKLGMGIAFGSTAAGKHSSYRRALKKYSSSIVFEDLGIWLYLIKSEDEVIVLAPAEVNAFLRGLDNWIAGKKRQR